MDDILESGSISAIRRALDERRLSARELAGWYLKRIESMNHSGVALNAVREVASEALEAAGRADDELAAGKTAESVARHSGSGERQHPRKRHDFGRGCGSSQRIQATARCDAGRAASRRRRHRYRQDQSHRICRLCFGRDAIGVQRRRRRGEEPARRSALRPGARLERRFGGGGGGGDSPRSRSARRRRTRSRRRPVYRRSTASSRASG